MSGLVAKYQDVVLHEFTDEGLPALALHVFAICARPLPDTAVQRIRHFGQFSARSSGQVACSPDPAVPSISAGNPGRQAQNSSRATTDGLDERLCDIADAVLLVAAKIDDLAAGEEPHLSRRHVVPFLKFLVATCIVSAVDGAVVSDDAWIAAPRLPTAMAAAARFAVKYVQTPLLVTLPLQHPELPRLLPVNVESPVADESPNPNASDATTSSESDSDLAKWLVKHPAYPPTIVYECDDGPPAPVNDGMQRSILAAEPPAHLLAVLVVDHCDRIYNTMSSALHQRRAWNILTPVVGISFSHDSTIVRVLVGWLDARATDDGYLPRVHLLHAPISTDSGSEGCLFQGIFCLADPVHVLCLARMLISCKEFFEDDRRKSQAIELTHDRRWRADQEIEPTGQRWSFDTLHQWCSGIDTHESPFTPSPSAPSERNQQESGSHPSSEAFRVYSFEEYIGLKETRGLKPPGIQYWLLDRYVGLHSLPPISAYSDPAMQPLITSDDVRPHLPFFETYRCATLFRWPHAWDSPDRLPAVPPFLLPLKHELFASYQSGSRSVRPGEQNATSELLVKPELTSVLERRLPTILQVCALARSLNTSSSSQRYRYCYDMLFSISAARNGVRFIPNASLRLSRSTLVDNMAWVSNNVIRSESFPSTILSRQISSLDAEEGLFAGHDEEFRRQIKAAYGVFATGYIGWKTALKDSLRRIREAPVVGVCDHVMVVGQAPGPLVAGEQFSYILTCTASSSSLDFPVPLLPSWTEPAIDHKHLLTYDILGTVHHDYPTMAGARQAATKNPMEHVSQFPNGAPDLTQSGGHKPSVSKLEIPLLAVVHGAQRIRFNIADSSRLHMCLVSSVHFLASLLVFDFPVFGLLTEGTICAVVMAWATRFDDHTEVQILGLNCNAYDISAPAGAFNLATFLFWLEYEHAPRLSEVLSRAQHLASSSNNRNPQEFPSGWAMEDQLRDLKQNQEAIYNQMTMEEAQGSDSDE